MHTTTYAHDEAGNITRIVDPLGGITEQTYDALGRLATRTLPNGVTSTWTYDARGWTDTIVHRALGGDVIASVDYTRSSAFNSFRSTRPDHARRANAVRAAEVALAFHSTRSSVPAS